MRAIDECQDCVASWNPSRCKGSELSCLEMDMLEVRVQKIIASGLTDLDCNLALFAIRCDARRNFIAHGGTVDLYQSSNFAGISELTRSPKPKFDSHNFQLKRWPLKSPAFCSACHGIGGYSRVG